MLETAPRPVTGDLPPHNPQPPGIEGCANRQSLPDALRIEGGLGMAIRTPRELATRFRQNAADCEEAAIDKGQPERSAETARDSVNLVKKALRTVTRPAAPNAQVPLKTQLGKINRGGIAELANGTYWRIAARDLPRARGWLTGANVTLARNDPGKMWAFKLTNAENGEQVAVARGRPFVK